MIPSVWTDYYHKLSPEDAILGLREAGFSASEFSTNTSRQLLSRGEDVEKTGLQFHSFMKQLGFVTPQGHLQFKNDLTTRETVEDLKKEITLFQAIGVKNAVLHINGGKELPTQQRTDLQLKHLRELLEFVKDTEFTICFENLRSNPAAADADQLLVWIEQLGGKNLGICLDTGHLHTTNLILNTSSMTQREFILKAGKYLKALHINGNDGTDDYHLTPFTIKRAPDWAEIVTSLREIDYRGLFNLELPGEIACDPPLYILRRKLLYIKDVVDYMLSDSFPEQSQ